MNEELGKKVVELLRKHEGQTFEGTLEGGENAPFNFLSLIKNVKLNISTNGVVVTDHRERRWFNIPFENLVSVENISDGSITAYHFQYDNNYNIHVEINPEE